MAVEAALPEQTSPPDQRDRALAKAEWAVAVILTVIAIGLRLTFMLHAGPLWRDEINSINLATVPTLSNLWNHLEFDSFPILWFLVLRAYAALGPGHTDIGLRILGFTFSVLTIGAFWWNARRAKCKFPLCSLLLIGLSPPMIQWGGSNRAYGFGAALMLFTFGCIWKVAERPTRRRIIVAAFIAFLAVQCFYYNTIMVGAFCVAGGLVALRARGWRGLVPFIVIGAVALLPLVAYLGMIKRLHSWNMLVYRPIDASWIWMKLSEVLLAAGQFTFFFWILLFLFGIGAALYSQPRAKEYGLSPRQRDILLYAATTLGVGTVGYLIFIKQLRYPTEPWYYVDLAMLIAVSVDVTIGTLARTFVQRAARLLIVVLLVGLSFGQVLKSVEVRQTNVDLVAQKIEAVADKNDMILVTPWFIGVSFERYYHGNTSWTTLPAISFRKYHRYDLMRDKMSADHPIDSILADIDKTLRSGHRVWVVGKLPQLPAGQLPPSLAPAPHTSHHWDDSAYINVWLQQAGYFMQTHAVRGKRYAAPEAGFTNHYEHTGYQVYEGWQPIPGRQLCQVQDSRN